MSASLSPTDVDIETALDATLRQAEAGNFAAAEQSCIALLGLLSQDGPQRDGAIYLLAMIRRDMGRPEEVVAFFKQAAESAGATAFHIMNYADCLARLGYVDEATRQYRRVSDSEPDAGREIENLTTRPFFPAFAGAHQPARQAYMAAAIHRKRQGDGPLRILEIGSYIGASAFSWTSAAAALTERGTIIHCVDKWAAYDAPGVGTDALTLSLASGAAGRLFQHNLRFFPPQATIERFEGTSSAIMPTLTGPYDLIYLDGSHLYDDVRSDLRMSQPLLAEGGFLCGDDLERQLADCDEASLRASIAHDIIPDSGPDQFLHPGVTLAVGEMFGPVSAYRGFWIMEKRGNGFRPVSLTGATGWLPRHWPDQQQTRVAADIQADGILAGLV